jgi:hypothetical protein
MSYTPAILALIVLLTSGCSAMLPRSKEVTASPWETYQEAQHTFDKIIPGATRAIDLKEDLKFDLAAHPNILIMNYSDVLRRFVPNASVSLSDLDVGVKDCLNAKTGCQGYEIAQRSVRKQREGNFFADVLGFQRETQTSGWSFNGLILVKDGVVIYKLTGGQPIIMQREESRNPLGPIQAIGQKFFGF